jgi:hypothetical protein
MNKKLKHILGFTIIIILIIIIIVFSINLYVLSFSENKVFSNVDKIENQKI